MFDESFTIAQRQEVQVQLYAQYLDSMSNFLRGMESRLTDPKPYDDEDFLQECITKGMNEVKGIAWYLVELGVLDQRQYNCDMYDFVIRAQRILDSDPDWKSLYHVW